MWSQSPLADLPLTSTSVSLGGGSPSRLPSSLTLYLSSNTLCWVADSPPPHVETLLSCLDTLCQAPPWGAILHVLGSARARLLWLLPYPLHIYSSSAGSQPLLARPLPLAGMGGIFSLYLGSNSLFLATSLPNSGLTFPHGTPSCSALSNGFWTISRHLELILDMDMGVWKGREWKKNNIRASEIFILSSTQEIFSLYISGKVLLLLRIPYAGYSLFTLHPGPFSTIVLAFFMLREVDRSFVGWIPGAFD